MMNWGVLGQLVGGFGCLIPPSNGIDSLSAPLQMSVLLAVLLQ